MIRKEQLIAADFRDLYWGWRDNMEDDLGFPLTEQRIGVRLDRDPMRFTVDFQPRREIVFR